MTRQWPRVLSFGFAFFEGEAESVFGMATELANAMAIGGVTRATMLGNQLVD